MPRASFVSQKAWEAKTFKQYDLHHLCYKDGAGNFRLSAQVAVRVIAKVADAYKLDPKPSALSSHWAVSPTMTVY